MIFPVSTFHLPVTLGRCSLFSCVRIVCSHTKHERPKERYLTAHPGTQMEVPKILIITFQMWPQ